MKSNRVFEVKSDKLIPEIILTPQRFQESQHIVLARRKAKIYIQELRKKYIEK